MRFNKEEQVMSVQRKHEPPRAPRIDRSRAFAFGGGCALALSLLGTGGQAHAQDKGAQAPQNLEEIVVTGSRIRRTSDFETSNPTTVVDGQSMKDLGIVNLGEAMPSNVSSFRPETTGNSNFFTGSTIANLRGLNPFFGSRTLTLVNTRRFVPTNQGDGVDLNFIPSILIDHVDSVTGGASAAYGAGFGGNGNGGTNPVFFDALGRSYRVGVRATF
jgi:outer membrane receptor protein involved in Fe transport